MTRKERLEEIIQGALTPLYLDLVDESYMHSVPPGSESHFKALVVSEAFVDLPLVERHRRVNRLLEAELQNGLHAVALHTWTPEEWFAKGGAAPPESPPCQGGSKPI